ncbi:hypothetical protein PybrP1_010904 [[Pythium] brassicae (nom. inval.)]|nr:hypothetical protein PybrP1_010904 [[Pythium] brassicae (nom. inval.)]
MLDKSDEHSSALDSFLGSALQVLAPNSLQFNEHEFQRSPKEAQDAARAAAKLVQPGDLIFITTSGFVFSMGRYLTANDYDHVVWRVPMADHEREKFLRCARELVGRKYDVVRYYQLVLRLTLKNLVGSTPLRKLPMEVNSDVWICSDSIMVLLAGCSERFREALMNARQQSQLDLFTFGSASLSDFSRIRRTDPDVLARVALPLADYTLQPQKRPWRAHLSELLELLAKVQAGAVKWPQVERGVFPKLQALSDRLPPASWSLQEKAKVAGYAMVLLVVLKRGVSVVRILLRVLQLVLLRYCAQQLLRHLDKHTIARALLAKL